MEPKCRMADGCGLPTQRHVTVEILRGVGSDRHLETYQVPLSGPTSVLGILTYIQENLDPTVAFYSSCRMGKCAGCYVRVNGEVKLACTTIVDGDIRIEPVDQERSIRDLAPARRVG